MHNHDFTVISLKTHARSEIKRFVESPEVLNSLVMFDGYNTSKSVFIVELLFA